MSEKTMKENLQSFAAKQILHYLDEDPEKSLPKLLEWADKFDKDNTLPSQRRVPQHFGKPRQQLVQAYHEPVDRHRPRGAHDLL